MMQNEKIIELNEQLIELNDAVNILKKEIPEKYRNASYEDIDACVRRARDILEDNELIEAFERKIQSIRCKLLILLS